jgi:hypothetical protein
MPTNYLESLKASIFLSTNFESLFLLGFWRSSGLSTSISIFYISPSGVVVEFEIPSVASESEPISDCHSPIYFRT